MEVRDYTVNIGTPAIAGFAAVQTGLSIGNEDSISDIACILTQQKISYM
jgi:hypothetical protein